MKDTIKYLLEPLLTRFFLIDALCDGFIGEGARADIFGELSRVFCVPESDELKAFYAELNTEQYRKITDLSSYERLCRLIQYSESIGRDTELTSADRTILSRKREAMTIKSTLFKQVNNLTKETLGDALLEMAENGSIDAMTTLSFMEYHGICVCPDRENALKRLAHCARWNDVFGNLMGIAYDTERSDVYRNRLYTVLRSSSQRGVFSHVCEFTGYSGGCEKDGVAGIIEKAFALGIVRRSIYDRVYASTAFSDLISEKDKEKLLLSKKKDILATLSDIPFNVKKKEYGFDECAARDIPLKRPAEMSKIFCGISPAVNGRAAMYRPVLIIGGDGYVTDMYISSLKKGFEKTNPVVEADGGMLTMRDFDTTKENFILRGLSDTKRADTVFIIRGCDELGEREVTELAKLLDYTNRCRFKLSEPTVSIDLSEVLIVLSANESNDRVRRLCEECDVVEAQKISGAEKATVINSLFDSRVKLFGCGEIKLGEGCVGYLSPLKADKMGKIMDGALKLAVYENRTEIVPDDLKKASAQPITNTVKREFGYLGGVRNEKN